jgi:hypothetical protein
MEDPLKLRFYVWLLRKYFLCFPLLCFAFIFFLSFLQQTTILNGEVEWEKIELQELEEDFGRFLGPFANSSSQ